MLLDIVSIANKYNIVVPLRHPSVAIVNKFLKLILRKLSQMIQLILQYNYENYKKSVMYKG